jgi:hypothetical protein
MPNDDKPERQQWDDLVTELDAELIVYGPVRHQLGKILYKIKVHLHAHGLDKGRKGRWEAILRERDIAEKSTARDWVVAYQQAEAIPPDKCFFPKEMLRTKKTRNSHKHRQNNSAETALLDKARLQEEHHARIVYADDRNPKNLDKNGRLAVECIFILTEEEKLNFEVAVKKLGPGPATRLMYEAVVKDKMV